MDYLNNFRSMISKYPINVFTEQYKDDIVKLIDNIHQFGENGHWEELIEILTKTYKSYGGFVDSTQLVAKHDDQKPTLFTPLHHAASGGAPKHIFEQLIELGATNCLKTAEGKTAYDIAKAKGLDDEILLDIPMIIKQKSNEIERMEKALHSVFLGRMERLIKDSGQALPQLGFFYEKGPFHYAVPGMYGGFNVDAHEDGIKVHSFVRVSAGGEQNHIIDSQGNYKEVD